MQALVLQRANDQVVLLLNLTDEPQQVQVANTVRLQSCEIPAYGIVPIPQHRTEGAP